MRRDVEKTNQETKVDPIDEKKRLGSPYQKSCQVFTVLITIHVQTETASHLD